MKLVKTIVPLVLFVLIINLLIINIPKSSLENFILTTGVFAPLMFIVVGMLSMIIAPISGTPIMTVGFFLFGSKVIWYGYVAVVLSSIINFYISRIWGIKLVIKLIGKENFHRLEKYTTEHGLTKLFLMRFFLGGYNDFISYAYGLGKVKFLPYFTVSTVSTFLYSSMLFSIITKYSVNINEFVSLLVGVGIGFIVIFSLADKLLHKHKNHAIRT